MGVIQNPGQLRMISSFLKVESVSCADLLLYYFCTEPGTPEIGFPIHIHIHGFAVESSCEIQLTTSVYGFGVVYHLRCGLHQ